MTLTNIDKLSTQDTLKHRVRGALINVIGVITNEDSATQGHKKRATWAAQTAGFNLEPVTMRVVVLVASDATIQAAATDGLDATVTDEQIATAVGTVVSALIAETA